MMSGIRIAKRAAVVGMLSVLGLSVLGLPAQAQLQLNEANMVSVDRFIQSDGFNGCDKPYEGYDFGIHPYSSNTNSVVSPMPGNPFPSDVDAVGNLFNPASGLCEDSTPETTLPNGWSLANATGFARVQGNGGDWLELVITEDHTDLRGWKLFWQNDENSQIGQTPVIGDNPDERGFIAFRNHKAFSDLRAGTILTLSEQGVVDEVRDKFPNDIPFDENGPDPHDTGHRYDLTTDPSFDPFGGDDWHVHFHVDEDQTDVGIATDYFEGYSDIKVDSDLWELYIFDPSNTSILAETNDPNVVQMSDLSTGRIGGPVGELHNAASVNSGELFTLISDPGETSVEYEDVDFSTFGTPNLYNSASEATLDGVQDFSALRDAVTDNTYALANGGTVNAGIASNWKNARSGQPAIGGPNSEWTLQVSTPTGSPTSAYVSSNVTVGFVSVMSDDSTATLSVVDGATLHVDGSNRPGRVLVMNGGRINVDANVVAVEVESFEGGILGGSGNINGTLINSGGEVQPGSLDASSPFGSIGTLSVEGDFVQSAGTLQIEIGGSSLYDSLSIHGTARLGGTIEVSLVAGYAPSSGDTFVIVDSNAIIDDGYDLIGDMGQLRSEVMNGKLVLTASGGVSSDFNNDKQLDCLDVDALVAQIAGPGDLAFDLTGDGTVDTGDLDAWLTIAGNVNLPSGNRYLDGDANLDGAVDGQDFFLWNANRFTATPAWCSGDFDANGTVDGQDFFLWNANKFSASLVPEPSATVGLLLECVALLGLYSRRSMPNVG